MKKKMSTVLPLLHIFPWRKSCHEIVCDLRPSHQHVSENEKLRLIARFSKNNENDELRLVLNVPLNHFTAL